MTYGQFSDGRVEMCLDELPEGETGFAKDFSVNLGMAALESGSPGFVSRHTIVRPEPGEGHRESYTRMPGDDVKFDVRLSSPFGGRTRFTALLR